MAVKTCRVSCLDLNGVEHAVEVSAGSLYGLSPRRCGFSVTNEWVEDIGRGQKPLSVKVKHPEIEHTVRIQDFERWLESTPRSPAEMILKNRLQEILAKGR
jgi:hypothetical protein